MKTELNPYKKTFSIQKRTGLILSSLSLLTSVFNIFSGLVNFGNTPLQAVTNPSVLLTFSSSLMLIITTLRDSKVLRYSQTAIVILIGFIIIILTEAGNLTGTLILLFGMALAYQYDFFASKIYIKMLCILIIYILAIFTNVILVDKLKLPAGIPTLLFSLSTIYLFWMVFREEIKTYLVRTNQLKMDLDQIVSDNTKLEIITSNQAGLIEEKNRELKKNIEEITEIDKELRKTLTLKNVLLKEVHHRVKNNLTVINGLLNLQRSDDDNSAINSFIDANSNRLHAMAAVHESVYQSESIESVDLKSYFSDITENLVKIYSENGEFEININSEDFEISSDIAVPLGIIINECVYNSFTYGYDEFFSSRKIDITVTKSRNNEIELIITDNGELFSVNNYEKDKNSAFSIWLIKFLAEEQLQGSFKRVSKPGNSWIIRFPYKGISL